LAKQVTVINGTRYRQVAPMSSPLLLKKDDNKRWIWTFNVRTDKDVA
jgi:hypothetical protein